MSDNFPALLKCVFQCACVFRISRIYVKSYNKHILTCTTKLKSITKKLNKDPITRISKKILPLLIQKDSKHCLWSDVFKFNDEYWAEDCNPCELENYILTYQHDLIKFTEDHSEEWSSVKILHLNINSIFSKVHFFS